MRVRRFSNPSPLACGLSGMMARLGNIDSWRKIPIDDDPTNAKQAAIFRIAVLSVTEF